MMSCPAKSCLSQVYHECIALSSLLQLSSAHGQLQRSIPSLMARLEVKVKRIADLESQVKASKEAQRKDYEK